MNNLPERKPNRLCGYDYSQSGAYFVTICVKDRVELLWNVGATCGRPHGTDHLSEYGVVIDKEIGNISVAYGNLVTIDKYEK